MLCLFYLVCADAKMLLCAHCCTRHDLKRKILSVGSIHLENNRYGLGLCYLTCLLFVLVLKICTSEAAGSGNTCGRPGFESTIQSKDSLFPP